MQCAVKENTPQLAHPATPPLPPSENLDCILNCRPSGRFSKPNSRSVRLPGPYMMNILHSKGKRPDARDAFSSSLMDCGDAAMIMVSIRRATGFAVRRSITADTAHTKPGPHLLFWTIVLRRVAHVRQRWLRDVLSWSISSRLL